MSRFNSLQERFDHLRNDVGFPVTLWEEFIQDCLAENAHLKIQITELSKRPEFDLSTMHGLEIVCD